MKRLLLLVSIALAGQSFSQCSDLIISEYVEGWSNNKALEIYNPTAASIDLSEYMIVRYSNGATTASAGNAVQLTGTLAPYDVHVAVIDKQDPNGMGQEAPVWDSLQARANAFYSPDYNVSNAMYFNGNDAVVLAKGTINDIAGSQLIDVFGKIGEDPGDAWSTAFPYTGAGVEITKDHSMIRKSTVLGGVTNPNISFFDGLEEYDTIPAVIVRLDDNGDTVYSQAGNPILDGNWNSLGSHTCDCAPASITSNPKVNFNVYPNPTTDGSVTISSNEMIAAYTIYNGLGQVVENNTANSSNVIVNLGEKSGVYLVTIETINGFITTRRVIVK